ncbi:MAG: hypothetical protein CO158_06865 [Piscirickettsiaceae bacterium CG_4_9_14_3_um_filter_43_564]|nr:flagellar hook-length control protein FliK [Thiomicrospira sp.]OIP94993.1 MAG: hypothetical protein AUK56_07110 [Thiomicrospira sp. CG2_30_44_34]PIQ04942.1 MAG: hypothetical protein COW74_03850 [Piscirickettsiaceae bacterium CG18_big_fil_WC_8_21_14_2_50_44_103]PIU38217.1 MAG: hypothetical protein COT01_07655 [Piscirickettsiaceae bacterium CG07_land_8_20_14_0_80_44_28]PIW57331.1 MAG: hypothetical protein COW14_06665 [Piscirickettsiaceae bacterium CG12_big_fil_rev_8_21_14_0_65_44_934]PIW76912
MAVSPTSSATISSQGTTLNNASAQGLKLLLGNTYTISINKVVGNQVHFSLAGNALTATSPQNLEGVKQLDVKVTQLTPTLTLQAQAKSPSTANLEQKNQAVVQAAYRQLLPNQIPVNQGLQQLFQLSQTANLPAAIQTHLSQLFEQLFRPNGQMTAKDLKNQLQASGLFLENNLVKQGKPVKGDIKAKLLQLLALTQQQSPNTETDLLKLSKAIHQTLNKLTLQQLQISENPSMVSIQLPLQPNRQFQEISMDIRKQKTDTEPVWETLLNIQLNEGEMATKISLQNESLSMRFWADNQPLEKKIEAGFANLRNALEEIGLTVSQLLISKQKPTNTVTAKKIALIDIHI